MPSTSRGISGVAVAAVGLAGVLIWSGINNQDLLTSFRSLAMGKPIPAGEQKKSEFKVPNRIGDAIPRGSSAVVDIAATYKGHPYIFGGGHGTVCPKGGMDCSGFVSCVLNRAGLMKGTLTTDGFKSWGDPVLFEDRLPGDLVVWIRGPGNGHMGIVVDDETMWHTPCTGCGGVQLSKYGASRDGAITIVRRPKGTVRSSG